MTDRKKLRKVLLIGGIGAVVYFILRKLIVKDSGNALSLPDGPSQTLTLNVSGPTLYLWLPTGTGTNFLHFGSPASWDSVSVNGTPVTPDLDQIARVPLNQTTGTIIATYTRNYIIGSPTSVTTIHYTRTS